MLVPAQDCVFTYTADSQLKSPVLVLNFELQAYRHEKNILPQVGKAGLLKNTSFGGLENRS